MKKIILTISTIFLFLGCSSNQQSINTSTKKEIKPQTKQTEEFERTISYQDIITKINDINTKKKNNQRIKEIVKEYQYNVSDDDSKNSAREKALNQVKVIILEEIGVFVESYLELNKIVTDEKYHKQFKQEIKNLTAGIIKTKILDEKYNGKQYYVKASVLVDPDSVSEGISEILKIKANQSEIKKLNTLLKSKENEIDMRSQETITLQKKITSQELLNRAKEEELKSIQSKLKQVQLKLQKYEEEERILTKKLSRLEKQVYNVLERQKQKAKKACVIKRGLLKSDVLNILGQPDYGQASYGQCVAAYQDSCTSLHYGQTIIYFNKNFVSSISGCY